MGLNDMAFISRLKVPKTDLRPIVASQPMFKNKYFSGIKKVTHQEVTQAVFGSRFIREVKQVDQ